MTSSLYASLQEGDHGSCDDGTPKRDDDGQPLTKTSPLFVVNTITMLNCSPPKTKYKSVLMEPLSTKKSLARFCVPTLIIF